jgi:hypothetical protein
MSLPLRNIELRPIFKAYSTVLEHDSFLTDLLECKREGGVLVLSARPLAPVTAQELTCCLEWIKSTKGMFAKMLYISIFLPFTQQIL